MSAVDDLTVQAVLEQVWESLLGEPLLPWTDDVVVASVVRAEVTLAGDWAGRVRLACDAVTAASLARTMLGVRDGDPVPDADVHDALGELANVVGGNVKGTLPGSTSLGLPRVETSTVTTDPADPADDAAAVRQVVLWHGAPVVVDVTVQPVPVLAETPA